MDISDDDRSALSGATAALRTIKRKQFSSRPASPPAIQHDTLPGLPPGAQPRTTPTRQEGSFEEPIRYRPSHQHNRSQGRLGPVESPTQPLPHRLKRSQKQIVDKPEAGVDEALSVNNAPREAMYERSATAVSTGASRTTLIGRPSVGERRKSHDQDGRTYGQVPSSSISGVYAGRSSADDQARRRLTKSRPDTVQEDTVQAEASPPESSEPRVLSEQSNTQSPLVDPRKMLQLMRKTRGRMEGALLHRLAPQNVWTESYCTIDVESAALVYHERSTAEPICIFKDLRGSRIQSHLDADSNSVQLHVTSKDGTQFLQILPADNSLFNAWFAALLCWRPVYPGQPMLENGSQERTVLIRQVYDYLPTIDTNGIADPIRKLGLAVLIEPDESRIGHASLPPGKQGVKTSWTVVSCTLRGRGELRLHSKDLAFIASVSLAKLPRSAIQRLSTSVLDADCVIAIYPQYAQNITACSRIRPIYLSFESQELFEVWFVLLRAHAIPELFGVNRMENNNVTEVLPGLARDTGPDLFRVIPSFQVRVVEARLWGMGIKKSVTESGEESHRLVRQWLPAANYFAEVLLDGQTRAKSSVKFESSEPIWYEQIELADFAVASSAVSVRVKKQDVSRPTSEKPAQLSGSREGTADSSATESASFDKPDIICGETCIDSHTIQEGINVEGKHSLMDEAGMVVGEVSLTLRYDKMVVLMDHEYNPLADLLLRFSNSLTQQIAQRIHLHLAKLSQTLLSIFQVSGQATNWLMYLAEEEIDGSPREVVPSRSRFARRLETPESKESLRSSNTPNREEFVRDVGRSATAEVNLLFRGNTLFSKALDAQMKRLGRDYLENTLGAKLREVVVADFDCEVDPSRAAPGHDTQKAWKRLIALTEDIWTLIRRSIPACPPALRMVFRHIRACADDRYGDYMRTVTYSSVSGFLFLRFFCAAVLNPGLFHLVDTSPRPRAQRTYTLLAKSLQGLANMTTFGNKEPFMAPMNAFLNSHRQDFKDFIDDICTEPADHTSAIPASYTIPLTIYQKSPLTSREGFLSLPHLIDRAKNVGVLVDLWLDNVGGTTDNDSALPGNNNPMTSELARFHDLCLGLRQRSQMVYKSADRADRVPSPMAHKWVNIAERMEVVPEEFWVKHRYARQDLDLFSTNKANETQESLASSKRSEKDKRMIQDALRRQTAIRQRAVSQPVASAAAYNGADAGPSSSSSEGEEDDGKSGVGNGIGDDVRGRGSHRKFWSRKRLTRTPDKRDNTD